MLVAKIRYKNMSDPLENIVSYQDKFPNSVSTISFHSKLANERNGASETFFLPY